MENVIYIVLQEFYEKNKSFFDLKLSESKWELDNWNNDEVLFSTNKQVKGEVLFYRDHIEYSKLSTKGIFGLYKNISTNGWVARNQPSFTKMSSQFKHKYIKSPLSKYQMGEHFFPVCQNGKNLFSQITSLKNLITEKEKLIKEQELIKSKKEESIRIGKLNESQNKILNELDKDGNGKVDVIEGNDLSLLLKKHQKSITEIDRSYVLQFVKISSYLKTKKNNIQLIFKSIKDTPNEQTLNQYVEILKDDIHSYNLILFNSLNMIV